ncbi:MAG: hypothetical protein ACFFFG_17955 [Candidatus Thorarchaeota archaeon]
MNKKAKNWIILPTFLIGFLLLIQLNTILVSAAEQSNDVTLSFTNLANPGEDHYEGWVIVDGSPISTGKFTLNSTGDIVDLEANPIDKFTVEFDPELATDFVLSLEPSGDTDSVPSAIKPLAGKITNNEATLAHNIGVGLSSISGGYILASPTDPSVSDLSGIWFLDPTSGTPVESLDLPDLSETDWVYEGWVVLNGTAVTTGTFDNGSMADAFDGYSGTAGGPPFPGEDFIQNAPSGLTFPTDISGSTVVISVEPRMDNDAAPFQFKPLVGTVPSNAVDHTFYQLEDKTNTLPTGMVSISPTTPATTPFFTFGSLLITTISIGIGFKVLRKSKENNN